MVDEAARVGEVAEAKADPDDEAPMKEEEEVKAEDIRVNAEADEEEVKAEDIRVKAEAGDEAASCGLPVNRFGVARCFWQEPQVQPARGKWR